MSRNKIVIGTTLAAFAMTEPDAWQSWLKRAERQKLIALDTNDVDVHHFAALQLDARGIEPFKPLLEKLHELHGEHWTYSLDDGRTEVTMTNRWRHITFGQNLVLEYCQSDRDVSHVLFLAADCAATSDIIPRMLEMEHPLVAPYISTYGLRGDVVMTDSHDIYTMESELPVGQVGDEPRYPFHVEDAMASAAALFIARDVFRRIRFRWDLDTGMSDDPCFHHDAKTLLGIPTYVRHDVQAKHYPEAVGAYDTRYAAEALQVQR